MVAELVKVHMIPAGVEMANGTDGIAVADSKEGIVRDCSHAVGKGNLNTEHTATQSSFDPSVMCGKKQQHLRDEAWTYH